MIDSMVVALHGFVTSMVIATSDGEKEVVDWPALVTVIALCSVTE